MKDKSPSSRRDFLKHSGVALSAGALAGAVVPAVHAAQDSTVQIALVGCGGRGTGAASNALSVQNGPVKLVAMADVFQNRLNTSLRSLGEKHDKQMEVPPDRQFISFDGYKNAI